MDTVQVSVVICMCLHLDIEAAVNVVENIQSGKLREQLSRDASK